MNRNVPSSSARYLRAFIVPPSCDPGLGVVHDTECGPRRANQQRVAPRPAQDLDELEPVDRVVRIAPDRDRAVALEQDRRRRAARAVRRTAPPRSGRPARRCPGIAERQERQARQEQRRLGQGRRVRDLAGQGQAHRRRQVGVGDRADVGSGRVDREVDRQVRGRAAAAAATAPRDPGGRARRRRGRRPSSSSLRRPVGVTSSRSASSRTERLPSPAEIRPRAPSRRPARMMRVGRGGERVHARHPTRCAGPRPWPAPRSTAAATLSTIGRCPQSRPPSRSPSRSSPLAQNRDFKVLLVSQGISSLGDAVSFTALPLLVLALTGSGFAMGIVGALQTLPDLFFGMVAGRHRRPERSQADDVPGRPRSGRPDRADPALGRARRPDDGRHPARRGPDEHPPLVLPGRLHGVGAGARRAQPGRPGELVSSRSSTRWATSSGRRSPASWPRRSAPARRWPSTRCRSRCRPLGLLFVRRDLRAPVDRPRQPLLTEIREGIDYIVAQPDPADVDPVLGRDLDPARAARHRPRRSTSPATSDEPPSVLGLILAAYGVGTVVGSLLTARRIGRGRVAEILLGGNLVMGSPWSSSRSRSSVPVLLAVAFVAGVAQSMVLVTYLTLRTAYSPDELLGRDREHGADDLARPAAGRPARRWRAHRPDQRVDDDRGDGHRGRGCQPRLRPDRGDPPRDAGAAMSGSGGVGERVADRGRRRPRRGWRTLRTRTRRARRPRRLPDRRTMGIRCRTSRTSPFLTSLGSMLRTLTAACDS